MKFSTVYEVKDWNNELNELKITPIYNDDFTKEIQIILPNGKAMQDHKAPGIIVVQVLKGEIDFNLEGKTINLKELMSIKVAANVVHNLLAKKDSLIRLTLSNNDDLKRVKSVEIF